MLPLRISCLVPLHRAALLLAAALSSLGCGHDAVYVSGVQYSPVLVIHAVLEAGALEHRFIVERTRAIAEGFYFPVTPVRGARVTVSTSGGPEHLLTEAAGEPGTYVGSFPVESERRYMLTVRDASGVTVQGSTLVPGRPVITAPASDTVLSVMDEMELRWTSTNATAGYSIVDTPPGTAEDPFRTLYRGVSTDTSMSWRHSFFASGDAQLRIVALDSAFVAYYRPRYGEGGDPRAVRSTLSGGYGFFGSYAISEPRLVRRQ